MNQDPFPRHPAAEMDKQQSIFYFEKMSYGEKSTGTRRSVVRGQQG